jgi:hypothetical protein
MKKIKSIGTVVAVLCIWVQSPAREPLRVGIDVPEPKLIHRVEIACPDAA